MPPAPSRPVCVVGAGLAGLGAAYALARDGVACVVVDKARGPGGRTATRWHDAPAPDGTPARWRVDHGAQVVTPEPGSRSDRLIRALTDPVVIAGPVVPFGSDGRLRPDEARTQGAPRLAFADGVTALARALAAATPGLDLRLGTTVTRLSRDGDAWTVETAAPDGASGEPLGPFRAVVLTPPAPQAGALARASAFAGHEALADALEAVPYRAQFTVVLAFDAPVALPHGAYALVNAGEDGAPAHAVAWLADETRKPGRAPDGAGLLVAQMSDPWTRAHYDADRAAVVAEATAAVEALVGPLPAPVWTDTQRWRYSLPDAAADADACASAEALGLVVAGDGVVGRGRAHLALEDGLAAGARLAARLAERP